VTHLEVELFDRLDDEDPGATLRDINPETGKRQLFWDLHHVDSGTDFADRTRRAKVERGSEYRRGDHVILLDEVRQSDTDAVSIDPDVEADVDLNLVGLAVKAAAAKIVLNPNEDGAFRLRIQLFNEVNRRVPNLVLYDWQFPPEEGPADLNTFHFADKTAFVIIDRGPTFVDGDTVVLQNKVGGGSEELSIPSEGPTTEVDLNTKNFADEAAALRFELT
jgi:hypothetical protein